VNRVFPFARANSFLRICTIVSEFVGSLSKVKISNHPLSGDMWPLTEDIFCIEVDDSLILT